MTQAATRSLADLQEMLSRHESEPMGAGLPVHPRLAAALPQGLRPGAVYAVTGSTTAAIALLAAASQEGWCAAVGLPDLSVEAAARWGTVLERLALVPAPGADLWGIVGTLIDAVDLIVVASASIAPAQARRLEARLRARQAAMVVLGRWPQATITIHARTVGWAGLAQGSGCLTEQYLELTVTGRGGPRTVQFGIPEWP